MRDVTERKFHRPTERNGMFKRSNCRANIPHGDRSQWIRVLTESPRITPMHSRPWVTSQKVNCTRHPKKSSSVATQTTEKTKLSLSLQISEDGYTRAKWWQNCCRCKYKSSKTKKEVQWFRAFASQPHGTVLKQVFWRRETALVPQFPQRQRNIILAITEHTGHHTQSCTCHSQKRVCLRSFKEFFCYKWDQFKSFTPKRNQQCVPEKSTKTLENRHLDQKQTIMSLASCLR